MQYSLALLGLAVLAVAKPMPQGVTADITPTAAIPAGCTGTYSTTFELSVVNASTSSSKRMAKRQSSATDALVISLSGGVLTDNKGRTGYIAANEQFQFDDPPQTGAIYTGGFSVCSNGTLALGSSAIWYECLSGSFYNLYETSQGAQCYEIYLDAIPYSGSSTTAVASQSTDGQIEGTTVASHLASTTSVAILTTISDHQIQAPTSASAVTSSAAVVTQITDGQIQASTGKTTKTTSSVAVITQITDGQIQASTGKATSSVAVITQITDGQIQATTASAAKVTSSVAVITQITDGQIQATTGAARNATSTVGLTSYTGAAVANNKMAAAAGALVFGAAAFLA